MRDHGSFTLPPPVYLSTVALECNRWTTARIPTIHASEWVGRAMADGFDGIELWENHFFHASHNERALLREMSASSPRRWIFNTYLAFDSPSGEPGEAGPAGVTAAIRALNAHAVKFNVGASESLRSQYLHNLRNWLETLPDGCRPLCECHPGTILEKPLEAQAFFDELDPFDVGSIVHPCTASPDSLRRWLDTGRVRHVHVQSRAGALVAGSEACRRIEMVGVSAPDASYAIEFTHVTGQPDETAESAYQAALHDARVVRGIVNPA